MKKRFRLGLALLLVCLTFAALTLCASAETKTGTCGDDVTYTLDTDTGVLTISGEGEMTDWSSSSSVPWYYSSYLIQKVVISDGVTSIGSRAFDTCSSLISVTIPNSVTAIGIKAFSYCSNLTSIEIPSGVESIENSTFFYCKSLKNVVIPSSVKYISFRAFRGCSSMTSITIPSSVNNIASGVFEECSSLKRLVFLNAQCSLDGIDVPLGTTIFGYAGSTAEAYAEKTNHTFVALEPTSLTAKVSAATYASGTATLRVTATPTVTEGMEVERYGVFFAPAKYADSYATNGQVVVKEGAIASGKPFVADLTDIPESAYDVKIYAWAFVKLVGVSDLVVCPLDPVSIHDIVK